MRPPVFRALMFAAVAMQAWSAQASMPVATTISGCVMGGIFTSDDGYVIRVRNTGLRDYDVSRFEGRRIRARGMLSPGDLLQLQGAPRDLGPCRKSR